MVDIVASSSLMDTLNEVGLFAIFFLGFLAFRSPFVRRLFGESGEDKLAEKKLEADYASGLYTAVVEAGCALTRPSETVLHCVAQALLESDPLQVPAVCAKMITKNRSLTLDSVCSLVLAFAPASLDLAKLEIILADLQKRGARPDQGQFCRALLQRGATMSVLTSRFGDLAHSENVKFLAEAEPAQPAALLEAFYRAPAALMKSSVISVLEALERADAKTEVMKLAQHSSIQQLTEEQLEEALALCGGEVSPVVLRTWTAHEANVRKSAKASSASEPEAVNALQQCDSVETALAIAAKFPAETRPTIVTNLALGICVTHDLAQARAFFRSSIRRDVITFNTLLRGEAKAASWDAVRSLLAEMKESSVKANHVTFNTLLHACVSQKGNPWPFIEAMENQGLQPDAITLTTVLRSVSDRDAAHVRKCLTRVQSGVAGADATLYGALLEAAARTKDGRLVQQAVEVSERNGCPQPGALAALLRAAPTFAEAKVLWQGLASPSEAEYSAMIGRCCEQGAMEEARELTNAMRAQGLVSMPVFALLIKAYARRKELEPAWELFGEIRTAREPVPQALFNSLLDVACRVGDMDRGEELWRSMPELGVEPDLISFSTLVKGYCVQGDLERALGIFAQIRRRGLRPDAILYHSILDGCANRQTVELAEQILRDMIADGHSPTNITLSILVKLYGRTSLERAVEVFGEIPAQYHFKPNAQVYTCLMSVALTHRNVPEALRVKKEMVEAGVMDQKAYTTLVKGCMRWNYLDDAASVAAEAGQLDPVLLKDLRFVLERRGRSELCRLLDSQGNEKPAPSKGSGKGHRW
jgi:pentatricopeptide repeat protein